MFKYPEHPLSNRGDPFRDAEGKNPFADEAPPAAPADGNVYAAPCAGAEPTYQPVYVATQPHRDRLVFRLGLWGFLSAVAGAAGTLVVIITEWAIGSTGLSFWNMLLLLGVCCAWPAWLMGRHDLAAMRAGAMDHAGWRRTRRGHSLGVLGTLTAMAPLIYLLIQLYLWVVAHL